MLKGLVKALRTFAVNMGYKYTAKEAAPSRIPWQPPRIRAQSHRNGVLYRYKCDRIECDKEYIGESEKTLEKI